MIVIDDLAFKIANALLNQDLVTDGVLPSTVQTCIAKMLSVEIGSLLSELKVHMAKCVFFDGDFDEEALCGQWPIPSERLTTDRENVTCKGCLKSLETRDQGRGYTYQGEV